MYSVDELLHALNTKFPNMPLQVDQNDQGNAWIDMPNGKSIEVLQDKGFGLHTGLIDVGMGENPNEVYYDVDSVIARVSELLA